MIVILKPLAIDIRDLVRGTYEEFRIALQTAAGLPADTSGLVATAKALPIQPGGDALIDLVADFDGSDLVIQMGVNATAAFGVLNHVQVEILDGLKPKVIGDGTIRTIPKLW